MHRRVEWWSVRSWGRESGHERFMGSVSAHKDEGVLETGGGDGCTTRIFLTHCTLKNGKLYVYFTTVKKLVSV